MHVNFKNNIMFKGDYSGVMVKDIGKNEQGIVNRADFNEFKKTLDINQDAEFLTDLIEQGVDLKKDLTEVKLKNANNFFNNLKKLIKVEFNNPKPDESISLKVFRSDRGEHIEQNVLISSENFVMEKLEKGMFGFMDISIKFPKIIK